LRNYEELRAFRHDKFDQIYHLAAWTQAGDFCLKHPGEQWIINQQINTNMLRFWQEAQPQAKLIAMGSSCCYEPGSPHSEENFLKGLPVESLFTYGMTKRMLYTGLLALNRQFGLRYMMFVPSTLYGPEYHADGRQMHFIFDIMRKIVDAKHGGAPPVLWGDGSQGRELVHVRDFLRAMTALVQNFENELVNIGAGAEHSIKYFAELICAIVGYDPALIVYDTSRYVGARSKTLDVRKLKRLLPEFARIDLKEGLSEAVDWWVRHRPIVSVR
jgi:GDP-L-fucose synthase